MRVSKNGRPRISPSDPNYDRKFEKWFWAQFIIQENGCRVWPHGIGTDGYGRVKYRGKYVRVHRLAFYFTHGYWPVDFACHHCDNKLCGNPKCLYDGTQKQNMGDAVERGRMARGEKHSACMKEVAARGDNHYSRTNPEKLARGEKNGSRLHPESRPRGEKVAQAKLTTADIPAIRQLRTEGLTQQQIASQFSVSKSQIGRILSGKHWAHI